MYTPKPYEERDLAVLHQGMRDWSFATLITCGAQKTQATHLPFLLDTSRGGKGVLTTHLARANAQYQDLKAGAEALIIFQGPHAFVSPSWYENRHTFPTWNYTAIHLRAKPRLIEEPDQIFDILRRTVGTYDTPLGGAWSLDSMPTDYTFLRIRAIAGVEFEIAYIEGKYKLNQDKTPEDRRGVIEALEASGTAQEKAVAELMRRLPVAG
jgi:transcriptional regulator